jgi:hypothetical protein
MAINLSRQGGYLKFEDTVTPVTKYYDLVKLEIKISGNNVIFPDGPNGYAYTDIDSPVFANVTEFSDQVGTWKGQALGATSGTGAVEIVASAYSTITSGSDTIAIAGTSEQGAAVAAKKVTIYANQSNTGSLFIGDSTVDSTKGAELKAGDSEDYFVTNLDQLYFDVSVGGEGYTYNVYN